MSGAEGGNGLTAHSGSLPPLDRRWALLLDVDGTLLNIAPTPERVQVPAGLPELLRSLHRALAGALALVSGRSLAGIDALFGPFQFPAAGQHGAELRIWPGAGTRLAATRPDGLDALLKELSAVAARHPGLALEDKGLTLAVHYRQAPRCEAMLRRLLADRVRARLPDYEILESRKAFDLRARGTTKGTAVEALMRHPPFRGRLPAFFGDDATDRDGFAAALAHGGLAVQVGPRRSDLARYTLASPSRLRAWLAAEARRLADSGEAKTD